MRRVSNFRLCNGVDLARARRFREEARTRETINGRRIHYINAGDGATRCDMWHLLILCSPRNQTGR